MKNKRKRSRDYVCPRCFKSPGQCTCSYYSQTLILIDYNLQPIIQKLNEAGYYTMDCCEGHWGDYKMNMYISFVKPINSCPIGFQKEKYVVRHIYKAKTEEEFKKEKEEMIYNLNHWLEELGAA